MGLTFKKADRTLRFGYDDEKKAWTDSEGDELDERTANAVRKAAGLLAKFTALEVADYVEKGARLYGFDNPLLVVELEEKTARGKRVVIGKERADGAHHVKGPVTSFVLIAAGADVETLLAVLEPPEAPVEQPAAAEAEE